MEWLLELLFEVFGELILQFIFEALAQAGSHMFRREARGDFNATLLIVGYALFGALSGAVSLALFPHYLLKAHFARVGYLILAPAALGCMFAAIGSWRARRGGQQVGLERFVYGYLFAFCFALVRFCLAQQAV